MNAVLKLGMISCLIACAGAQQAVLELTVVDESQQPIAGANALVEFVASRHDLNDEMELRTDRDGKLKAAGWSKDKETLDRVWASIDKDGYYRTEQKYLGSMDPEVLAKGFTWTATAVLRKKLNPIPLYARHLCVGVPVHEEWAGYDLIMADWLPPHGQGKEADLWMFTKIQSDGKGSGSGSLKIKFAEGGGLCLVEKGMIKESEMKMPHQAAEAGYQPLYEREASSYLDPNRRDGIGYFLRSRVKLQDGKLLAANYGKITEDIQFDPRQSGWHVSDEGKPTTYGTVSLIYYFNPTPNDRNLEFDPKKNLFESLDPLEEVHAP